MTRAAVLDIDPFSADFILDPYQYHSRLREAGPVVLFPKYGIFGLARYAEVKRAISDWECFCSSRGIGLADLAKEPGFRVPSLLAEVDPPRHTLTRDIMNKIVALPRLKKFQDHWRQVASGLVYEVVERGSFDAAVDLSEQFPLRIFPDVLGLPKDGRENLFKFANFVFNAFGPTNDIFLESQKNLGSALEWIAEACRYESLAPGSWGREVHHFGEEAGLETGERELLCRSFLVAGVDTTTNGIGNLVYAFCKNPLEWERLRADRSLIKKAIEEGLRWKGPAQVVIRTTTKDVEISGVTIPAGCKVIAFLGAANRDPRQWNDPDRFDINRSTSGHVAFGFGIHQCLGQMIARLEMEAVLEALADRVERIELSSSPIPKLNNFLHGFQRVPVTVELVPGA